jgi:hypothetical protein
MRGRSQLSPPSGYVQAEEGIKVEEPHSPFKAAPMPNFSKPFKPDLTTVPGPTQAAEFDFETDKRLGKVDISK